MKRIVCEMCGSNDFIKQDGTYICESCGTKYSVEEAKKMMIEGTVDVSGSTVKVDTSGELANLYKIARRAKDDNNGENAAKYYDMILVKDPTSWEAAFYIVYFKAVECKIAQIRSAAISVNNCEDSVLCLIRDYVPKSEQLAAVREVLLRSALIANMLADAAENHYNGISLNIRNNYTQEYVNNACAARDIMYTCGSQIDRIFGQNKEIAKLAADAWKIGIEIHTKVLPFFADVEYNKRQMVSYAKKIGKYDSNFEKKYVGRYKKPQLEAEIAKLKRTISNAEGGGDGSVVGLIVVFFFTGFLLLGVGAKDDPLYCVLAIIPFVFGALLSILLMRTKTDKALIEKDKAIADSARQELKKLEAELKEIEAELNK